MSTSWEAHFQQTIQSLKARDLYRSLRFVDPAGGGECRLADRTMLSFCSNDYLGLAADPRLSAVSRDTAEKWGSGSGASRLVSGNPSLYRELEHAVCRFKETEAALVFATGYAANTGVIPALAGPEDLVLSDALNHASIVDGCKLSRGELRIYPHGDVASVETILKENEGRFRRTLVVTDGVFSMDGDLAPLPDLIEVCRRRNALLMVDDAHGTGVLGDNGKGTVEHFGVKSPTLVQVGTFSKALGGLGGFVCGSSLLVDYLINKARTLIYSTGLPPAVLAANREALNIASSDGQRREHLLRLVNMLRSGLRKMGYEVPLDPTPIIPLVVGDSAAALALSRKLWDQGIYVPAIRPPSVPEGASRLRISLSAAHRTEQVERLLAALAHYS